MKNMIFESGTKQIIFDDFTDNRAEYGSYWAEMCPCCYEKYKDILGKRVDDGGIAQGTCCVKGCWKDADYYVDFDEKDVWIVDENGGLDMKSDVKNGKKND